MIKKRINEIKEDYFQWIPLLISVLMIVVNLWQWHSANIEYSFIRAMCWVLQLPMVLILGRRGMFIWLVIYSQVLVYVNGDYKNFSGFFIIDLCCIIQPRFTMPMLLLYSVNTFVIAQAHMKEPSCLAFHILFCACLYITTKFAFQSKFNIIELDLTVDEEKILQQMLNGTQQNEIDGFSVASVTRKIRAAKDRNSIASTEELLKKYKQQKQQIISNT